MCIGPLPSGGAFRGIMALSIHVSSKDLHRCIWAQGPPSQECPYNTAACDHAEWLGEDAILLTVPDASGRPYKVGAALAARIVHCNPNAWVAAVSIGVPGDLRRTATVLLLANRAYFALGCLIGARDSTLPSC